MTILQIHKTGDYQTDAYSVGFHGVKSIERFNIIGLHADYPRIRVTMEDNRTVEMDEHGLAIYEQKEATDDPR
jgi:hypothetical protein